MLKNYLHFLQPVQGMRTTMTGFAGLILLLLPILGGAQPMIKLEPSSDRKAVYNNYFRSYALGKMDKGQAASLLQSQPAFDSLVIEANGQSFPISLQAKDVRADNYVLRVQNESGIVTLPRSPNKTYSGITLEGGLPVCITADEHFFTAMIMTREGALFIESGKLIDAGSGEDEFIIYYEKDVIQRAEKSICGTTTPESKDHATPDTTAHRSMTGCKTVKIAIANDLDMYTKWGSSAPYLEIQNLAVLNAVNTNYDGEFTTQIFHQVVEIFIATVPDIWGGGTDIYQVLDSFTAWAPTGFSTPHDVGSLWVNRWMDGSIIGLAWLGQLCHDSTYNVLHEYSLTMPWLRSLQAHELAHNYGAVHDVNFPNYIMWPTNTGANAWSPQSISFLNSSFEQNGGCLGECPGPTAGRVGIGTTSPDPNAILDISSTSKGVLLPRMTTTQRNQIFEPPIGLTIFDTNTKSYWFHNGSQWIEILGGADIVKHNQNVGMGISYPTNRLDIATTSRINAGQFYHPANLPVYITGTGPDFTGLEVRSHSGEVGVGLNAWNLTGGIFATGWGSSVPLLLSSKGPGKILLRTNGADRMTITGSGNMGLGTNAPHASAILDMSSTTKGVLIPRMTTSERSAISSPQTGLLVFDNTTNSFWYRGTLDWVELTDNLDQEVFRNGTDKIYMGLTDSVGIGTNAPKYKMDVRTAVNQYGFAQTDGTTELASWIGDGGEIGTVTNHTFRLFANNGYNQFELLPNGNIGLNIPGDPANKLDIAHGNARTGAHASSLPLYITGNLEDASAGPEFRHFDGTQGIGIGRNTLYAAGSWADQNIGLQAKGMGNVLLYTNGEERFRFSPTGQLGIGVTNIHGTIHMASVTANRKMILWETADNDHQYYGFGINGSTLRYQVDATISDHVFYAAVNTTTSNELMRIKGNGNVKISGTIEVENFIIPTLLNNFTQYGNGFANAAYYKDKEGRIHLRGLVNNVNNPTGLVIFTLPVGYRPSTSGRLIFSVSNNGVNGRIDILPNGDVMVMTGITGWVGLDGISFKAD